MKTRTLVGNAKTNT